MDLYLTLPQGVTLATFRRVVVLALTLSAGALVLLNLESPLRAPLSLLFLLFAPGWALAGLLRLRHLAAELMLGVAASISLNGLLAMLALSAGWWSPSFVFAFVVYVTLLALGAEIVRATRSVKQSAVARPRRALYLLALLLMELGWLPILATAPIHLPPLTQESAVNAPSEPTLLDLGQILLKRMRPQSESTPVQETPIPTSVAK